MGPMRKLVLINIKVFLEKCFVTQSKRHLPVREEGQVVLMPREQCFHLLFLDRDVF